MATTSKYPNGQNATFVGTSLCDVARALTFVNAVKYLFTLYYSPTSQSDVPTDARRYGKRGKG